VEEEIKISVKQWINSSRQRKREH